MLLHHRLDDLDNFFLLTAGQSASGLKNLLQAAFGRLAFGFGRRDAKQHVHADAQGLGHLRQHLAAWGRAAEFPKSDVGMVDTKLLGQLHLRQTSRLPQFDQALPQRRTFFFTHGLIIPGCGEKLGLAGKKSLHHS